MDDLGVPILRNLHMSVLICKLGDRNESKDFMGDWCFLWLSAKFFIAVEDVCLYIYIYIMIQ